MSYLSVVAPAPVAGQYTWTCEYCGAVNGALALAAGELPAALPAAAEAARGVDYMLTPPSAAAAAGVPTHSASVKKATPPDASAIIFVCDTSGSMDLGWGVSTGTRLEALKVAVKAQIRALAATKPTKRVGLVTFASDVTILGDGTEDARTVTREQLNNWDVLRAAGEAAVMGGAVADTCDALCRMVSALRATDMTALGPALLVAIAMAARVPGSKVVVTTDGVANVGLGVDARLAAFASAAGVPVDVIGFEGAECNLEALGTLAAATGGFVTRVNHGNMAEQFASVLEDEVVATAASITMLAHAGLFIRDPAVAADNEVTASDAGTGTAHAAGDSGMRAVGGTPHPLSSATHTHVRTGVVQGQRFEEEHVAAMAAPAAAAAAAAGECAACRGLLRTSCSWS